MPIEMPKGLRFSVDTWTPLSKRKRYHFLTHAHRDHLAGAAAHASYPIYATRITRTLVLGFFPQLDESLFVEIEVGRSVLIDDPDGAFSVSAFDANHCLVLVEDMKQMVMKQMDSFYVLDESLFVEIEVGRPVLIDDPDGAFSVSAFDANHCLGAVMFLFEGEFGNVLHTGDCRLTADCLQNFPLKYLTKKVRESVLDYLFLDCTFGRCSLKIPSKQSSIQQVISCIWKHPSAPMVYLACDLLGQEEILIEICRAFGSKIYVDKNKSSEFYQSLLLAAPEILSQDSSSRLQVIEGFPRLGERAIEELGAARANIQPEPLFIRPSTQWYASNDHMGATQKKKPSLAEAERDEFGVWHVCYSMHSSRDELEWALQLLQPKWVISTTPPCRAMELDYVKNHCYKTRITPDDPLWKLLNGPIRKPMLSPLPIVSDFPKKDNVSTVIEVSSSTKCTEPQLENISGNHPILKVDFPQLSNLPPLTLFGRARLGPEVLQEEFVDTIISNEVEVSSLEEVEHASLFHEDNTAVTVQECLKVDAVENEVLLSPVDKAKPNVEKWEAEVEVTRNMSCIISSSQSFSIPETSVQNLEVTKNGKETSCIGSSRNLNSSLRKLYRSMNVPVPRPLPSLVELMGSSKRIKIDTDPV